MNERRYSFYFYIFVVAHVVLWTLLPALLRYDLPLDSIEAISWGHDWQLGYLKHPPLSAWLADLMIQIFSIRMWPIYFLAQLCVAVTFIATWSLAKDFLTRQQALMAVILLEAIYYFNFTSIEYNANIALMPFWALVTLCAWRIVKNPQLRLNWLSLALLSALAFYAKYYSVMLFGGIFLLFCYDKNLRRSLISLNPYLFVLIFLALIAPHILWLIDNDFTTFAYARGRFAAKEYHYYNHLLFPILFLLAQLASLLLPLLIFFIAKRGVVCEKNYDQKKTNFLIFVGLVPLILAIFPSLLGGGKMKDMWGSVMWSWFGLGLFYFYQPRISAIFAKRFYCGIVAVVMISILSFIAAHLLNHNKYGHFNGKLLVEKIHEKYHKPIKVVVGDIWLAGNVNFFDKPRPQVLIDLERRKFSTETLAILERDGGIILWNARRRGDILPQDLRFKLNAHIQAQEPLELPYFVFTNILAYRVGWAIVVPL